LLLAFAPGGRHQFARTGMPDLLRMVLSGGEIIGAALFLIPPKVVRGAWLLIIIFVGAIAVHLLHGMTNVGSLVIYTAAAWAVGSSK
jgi:DoxX-like protein